MKIKKELDLSLCSNWRVGGLVRYYLEVTSVSSLLEAIAFANSKKLPYLIVGRTSNLLFTDEYINGAIIRLNGDFEKVDFSREIIVGSACFVPRVARLAASSGYRGLEHTAGIPASFGGLITMNGGSQRKWISSNIEEVTSLNEVGELVTRSSEHCGFAYRESIFKYNNEIVVSAKLRLEEGDPTLIRREMLAIMSNRRNKFPLKLPNCGSVFKSSPELFEQFGAPGKVIEKVGLKGKQIGQAQISKQHANFFVNLGGASSQEILSLINLCRDKVQDYTGYRLDPEVRYIDSDLKIREI